MIKKTLQKAFSLSIFISLILFICAFAEAKPDIALWKDLDVNQARIYDYQGLVEVIRDGKPIRVRKNTALNKTDEIIIYYDSYLELYFGRRKENIVRIEGENIFILQDISKLMPYGFEIKYDDKRKTTQTVMMFSEKSWMGRYLELLQKGKIPYTVVFVKEGVVAAESLDVTDPKEVLIRQGQMTYVFKGKDAFNAMPWAEFIDMCIEDCWGEW